MYRDTLFRLSTQDVSFNDRLSNGARRLRFFAGFALMYSVEFFCLSISKLMVLERMRDFASQRTGDDGTRATRRLAVAVKTVLWAVAALNAAGIVSNIVAAGYYFQASALFIQSAAAYAEHSPSDNSTAIALQQRAADNTQNGGNALAVQNFCESGALLIIICAFIIVGGISARRFNNVRCDINPAVRHLRWQIVLTVVVVFITFLMRAVFALMLAFADGFQNDSDEDGCMGDLCDPVCNNVFSTMQTWLLYCPTPCAFALTDVVDAGTRLRCSSASTCCPRRLRCLLRFGA